MIKDFFGLMLVAFLLIVGITAPLIAGQNYYNSWTCGNFAELSKVETKYVNWDTCYVKAGDQFIRYEEYMKRAIAQNLGDKK